MILHKWMQASLQSNYRSKGMYSGLMDTAGGYVASLGEDFVVELPTRPVKQVNSVFGRSVLEMPSFDLSTEIGFANYMLAVKNQQVKQAEEQKNIREARQSLAEQMARNPRPL